MTVKCGINIGSRARASLLSQLRRDTELLVDCGVMDYSLLVGIVKLDRPGKEAVTDNFLTTTMNLDNRPMEFGQQGAVLSRLTVPMRQLFAPLFFIAKQLHNGFDSILLSILTFPLPYYGAGICPVDGGLLSVIPGYRFGYKSVYYIGIIDFLQPWTARKVVERELKGVLGYDKKAISCVHPKEYSLRFLEFLSKHIT